MALRSADEAPSRPELNVTDPETGLSRVCARHCYSCILHPNSAQRLLDPEPLTAFLSEVIGEDSYVVCHNTGSLASPEQGTPPAICAGFMAEGDDPEREYWRLSWRARLIKQYGRELPVPPPERKTTALHGTSRADDHKR